GAKIGCGNTRPSPATTADQLNLPTVRRTSDRRCGAAVALDVSAAGCVSKGTGAFAKAVIRSVELIVQPDAVLSTPYRNAKPLCSCGAPASAMQASDWRQRR